MEAQDRQTSVLHQLVQQQMQGVTVLTLPQSTTCSKKSSTVTPSNIVTLFKVSSTSSKGRDRVPVSVSTTWYNIPLPCPRPDERLFVHGPRKRLSRRKEIAQGKIRQSFRIAAAHINQLTEGLPIKAEDGNALLQFSIQLTSCTNTLR